MRSIHYSFPRRLMWGKFSHVGHIFNITSQIIQHQIFMCYKMLEFKDIRRYYACNESTSDKFQLFTRFLPLSPVLSDCGYTHLKNYIDLEFNTNIILQRHFIIHHHHHNCNSIAVSSSSSQQALLPGFQRLRLFHCLPRFFRSPSNLTLHCNDLHCTALP